MGVPGIIVSLSKPTGGNALSPQEQAAKELETGNPSKSRKRVLKKVVQHKCSDEEVFTRYGDYWEHREDYVSPDGRPRIGLNNQSEAAYKQGVGLFKKHVHGVSISSSPPRGRDYSQATAREIKDNYLMVDYTPTRNDPEHHTLQFWRPIPDNQENAFNQTFKRTK